MELLKVEDLKVSFPTNYGAVQAVRGCSFSIEKGKTLGLVGESGCGKTVSAYSILGLVPSPGVIERGKILYNGNDLLKSTEEELRSVRGGEIAMIFQEPMASLNPVYTVGFQITESLMLHRSMDKKSARAEAVSLLNKVGIPNPNSRIESYAHELSGGMCQRVMIAMALAGSPSMLIADEPTTALDVTIQAQILDLLLGVQEEEDMSMLFITHDLGVVANTADDLAIMYAGEIAEISSTGNIIDDPLHPYTQGLFDAIPKMGMSDGELKTIPGTVPSLIKMPQGCVFYPRCPKRTDECLEKTIDLEEKKPGHFARCIHTD